MASKHYDGVISFMYWVMHDNKINQDFHENENATMNNFNLGASLQKAFQKVGQNHTDQSGKVDAANLMDTFLLGPFLAMWNIDVNSIVKFDPPSGWLSFMYFVTYNQDTNKAFLDNAGNVLKSFGITDNNAVTLINSITTALQAGNQQAAETAAKNIFENYITDELLEKKPPRFW